MVRDWSAVTTYVWTPPAAGSYRVGIWARSDTTTEDVNTVNYSVPFSVTETAPLPTQPPTPTPTASPGNVKLTGLTASASSPQFLGSTITFTASSSSGKPPHQFKWWVYDGTTWIMARDWGSASFTWTPTQAGSYRVGVWARDASSTADVGTVNMSIPYEISEIATLHLTGLVASDPSPRTGSPVVFTATAAGGEAPYEFKWWMFEGSTGWRMVRDWGQATYSWTPTATGEYRVGVWLRSAGTTADTGAINTSIPVTVSAP
jgi:hypothetical protein